MDPDATLAIMVDESNDLDERAVAATDLLVWLANGRRPPEPRPRFGGNVAEFCRYRIFQALDLLAKVMDDDELAERFGGRRAEQEEES